MIDYLIGEVEIRTSDKRAIGILAKNGIQCSHIVINDSTTTFRIPLYKYGKTKDYLAFENIDCEKINLYGIPMVLYKYRRRFGLFLGAIIFSLIVSFSDDYIWSFDITGNSNVADEVILDTLESLGCGIGSKINELNFDVLHNKFLIECSDIAWISVNMEGTHANVEVREVGRGEDAYHENCNIVAKEDGQVTLITVINGKEQVAIGDVVKKGDMLISGVETYREGEKTYYTGADGNVLAEVNRTFAIEKSIEVEEKVLTGNVEERKVLNFFGFDINLFVNSRIPYEEYDIITENKQIVLFDCVELPLWVRTDRICEYEIKNIKLSEDETESLAIKEYRARLAVMAKEAELIRVDTVHSFENGVYRIECNLYCITDIAEAVPFTIVNEGKEDT